MTTPLQDNADEFEKLDLQRVGVLVGTGMGGLQVFQDGVQNLVERGYKKISPFFIPYAITNMCAGPPAAQAAENTQFPSVQFTWQYSMSRRSCAEQPAGPTVTLILHANHMLFTTHM